MVSIPRAEHHEQPRGYHPPVFARPWSKCDVVGSASSAMPSIEPQLDVYPFSLGNSLSLGG